jgi:hypothetical protein
MRPSAKAGIEKEAQVSDEERKKFPAETEDEEGAEDVEAHKLSGKLSQMDEDGDDGADVEAHKLS